MFVGFEGEGRVGFCFCVDKTVCLLCRVDWVEGGERRCGVVCLFVFKRFGMKRNSVDDGSRLVRVVFFWRGVEGVCVCLYSFCWL